MTLALYTLDPLDTTAFRDGRPFEQDDQGMGESVSVFPPPPPAITGAVMVALARAIGIPPAPEWRQRAANLSASNDAAERSRGVDIGAILDTPIAGPFIVWWDGGSRWELLSRCPADLLFDPASSTPTVPIGRIKPSTGTVLVNIPDQQCEVAELRREDKSGKPFPRGSKSEPIARHFLRVDALHRYLTNGTIPDRQDLLSADEFCSREPRIGIAIEKRTGTAVTGQLYAAEHRRLSGAERKSRFFFGCEAPLMRSLGNATVDVVVPLGGEGRSARVRGPIDRPRGPDGKVGGAVVQLGQGHVGARLVALTPIPVTAGVPWGLDLASAPSLNGAEIIGAVHDRPESVGFIPRAEHASGKIRVIRAFPAGSTWFLKVPAAKGQEKTAIETIFDAAADQRLAAAELALCGFGRFAAGKL